MCNPQRLDHFQYDRATDYVPLRVLPVGIVGLDVELGVVVRLGRQGGPEPGEERSAWGWRRRFGGRAHLTGTHNLGVAHIMRLRAVVGGKSHSRQDQGALGGTGAGPVSRVCANTRSGI